MASGCQRQLPRRTRNPKDEQNPAPPPSGGGVSSFWGENKTRPCATIRGRLEGGVEKRHHPSLRQPLLARREAPVEACTAQVKAIGRTGLKEERLKMKSQTAKDIYTKSSELKAGHIEVSSGSVKSRKYLPLGRASIASGYTALVASGDRLAPTEPAGENGRTPRPPAGGVFKGKVKDATQKKGQKKERRAA